MEWFYALGGRQEGPVPDSQLEELLRAGTITPDTLIWREGMADWQPLNQARPSGPPMIPVAEAGTLCAECRRPFPRAEMVLLNQSWVCAACKPVFLQRMMEGAAPATAAGLIWRSGRRMVLRAETPLPDRCVCCNEPAQGFKLKRQLYWHHPAWYLLILVSLLIYAIVALCIRKRARIDIGLCGKHRSLRRWIIAGSWLAVLGGLIMLIVGLANSHGYVALVGGLAFLGGALFGAMKGPVVSATKIDNDLVWVNGAGESFLATLPEWTGPK